ncbi:MAG: hypothetical protein WAU58_16125 [Terriglobales bacterium]
MKLGTENRKQLIALAVLGGIALLSLAYQFWPASTETASAPAQANPSTAAHPAMRRTASGKMVPITEPRLDPTLDLNLLAQSEDIKYAGNGRNIFVAGSLPTIDKPKRTGATDKNQQAEIRMPPPVPPPPPINLKFFGFANKPGEAKRVFLVQGEDVFIAGEGDIVDRRYRVLHITNTAVEMEDVLNNNRQSIPLTQG